MRCIFSLNCGSRLAFQVLVACQRTPAVRRICRTVSALTAIRCRWRRCSTSFDRLHVVNGIPACCGGVRATRQISSRMWGPNLGGRPPLHFGSSAANPWVLNAWITSRAYCGLAANIAAASAALRPWTDASTIPARRSRTRSRAVLVILTSRSASSGVSSRTKTSGRRGMPTTSGGHPPAPGRDGSSRPGYALNVPRRGTSQFRRHDSEMPRSFASCTIGCSPRRARSTAPRRNSDG